MTTTAVSICANALLMLGQRPISSFDEAQENDHALLAASLWPTVRDYVLRSHPWNCAIKRVSLAADVDAPSFDYRHQFTLPGDFLRALSVGREGEGADYKIEGGKLLSDEGPCLLRYIFRNDDPASYDGMLVMALTAAMRCAFAYPTTQSTSLEAQLDAVLRPLLKQARAVDGMEDTPERMGDSPLMQARYMGSTHSRFRG